MNKILVILVATLLLIGCTDEVNIPESWSDGIYSITDYGKSEFCMYHYDEPGARSFYLGIRDSMTDSSLVSINLSGTTTDNSDPERIIELSDPQSITLNGISTTLYSMRINEQIIAITVTQNGQKIEIPLYKRTDWTRKTLVEGIYNVVIDSFNLTVAVSQNTFSSYTLNISDAQNANYIYTVKDYYPLIINDSLFVFNKEITDDQRSVRGLPSNPTIYTLNGRKYTNFTIACEKEQLLFKADYNNFNDTISYSTGYVKMELQ